MATIFLWTDGKGWESFYSDNKAELEKRGIKIGDVASIGYRASIGENEKPKTIFITGSKHSVNYWGARYYKNRLQSKVNIRMAERL